MTTDVAAQVFPASFAQRRLWFLAQLEPNSPFYHVPLTLGLTGSLDVPALRRSLATIVARHEVLRTTLTGVEGEPVQVIGDPPVELPVVPIAGDTAAERERDRERQSREAVLRPFDLRDGPLFRFRLFRLAEQEHVLQLVFHHAVFDGWSASVLFHELSECYRAYALGATPRLPELPIQYVDYAAWQRQWLTGDVLARQLAYWRTQLDGAPALLDLPNDYRPPLTRSYRGATRARRIPRELLDELRGLSERQGVTLFMTLLAAFQVLLARWTGAQDVVVGTPIANRTRPEIQDLIGFFVNSLALRTDLSGDPSFVEALGRVRETAVGGYSHQDLPFERLVEELHVGRIRDRNPVFQVMFALQNMPRTTALQLPGLTIRRLRGKMGAAKFDLTLHAGEDARGLRTSLEYSVDLFEEATIDGLLAQYHSLLADVVADPERRVSRLRLMSPAARRALVGGHTSPQRPYGGDHCIQHWFEVAAAAHPTAIAVQGAGGERLTYDELDRRANRLARALRRMGVAPEARVGVALERSPELVVALLAVLKAGGAYVPIDPNLPAERVGAILEDASVSLLIGLQSASPALPPGVTVLLLDADKVWIDGESDQSPRVESSPDHLAYVMYTSGSTGSPKGIGVPHRAVLRLVRNSDYVQFAQTDVVAHISNPAFDATTFELWGALLHGARLVVIPRDVALSPRQCAEELRRTGITVLFLTTALFNQIAEVVPEAFAGLHHLLFGGEAVNPDRVRLVLERGAPRRLLHVYGPTETTTFATWHEVPAVRENALTVPIGRPIANTRAYVLDRAFEPVPPGVPGELFLGGPGLARGYQSRAALTAERFVPDPFGTEPGGRLYRTGDRVRWRPDGALEFLGRFDEQVKIRGFRVEPGEIEAVLANHPAVERCAVVSREDMPGGRALVAYIVPRACDPPPATPLPAPQSETDGRLLSELRTYLRERLPDYMVPAAFVPLAKLPLSSNGKIARQALPRPASLRLLSGAAITPPRTPLERSLAAIWCTLLGVEEVGREDGFFDLGGHSLLVARLFAEIERTFHRKVPLSAIFKAPTLGQLADLLSQDRPAGPDNGLVPLQPTGTRPPLFVMHSVRGDVLEYRQLVSCLGSDQPVYGFEPPVTEAGTPVLRSFQELAADYVRRMREAQSEGPYHIAGYCWGGPLAYEIACQLGPGGHEVGLLALIESRCPGTRVPLTLPRRMLWRTTRTWESVVRNLKRLAELPPPAIPGFVRQRLANAGMRLMGASAFRWSLRLNRPVLPAFREVDAALTHAGRVYRPGPYSGLVTVLRSRLPGSSPPADPSLGWARLATGGVESHEIPGRHLSIMRQPDVETLAVRLRACLDRAHNSAPTLRVDASPCSTRGSNSHGVAPGGICVPPKGQ